LGIPPERVEQFLQESRSAIDRYLESVLPAPDAPPPTLHEAMRYAVFSGGKRLRPALAFGASLACGREPEVVLPVAAAVELVHAYSLVHDDLPAMDDDVERRGRPTVHVRYGEATAILVGDALLAEAFRCLARGGVGIEVVERLAEVAGSRALVGGQADDLSFSAEGATERRIVEIHARKTAALFGFAVWGAARCVGAERETESRLAAYAEAYGLAFQLADDLSDARPEECSILRVLPEAEARGRLEAQVGTALRMLETLPPGADPLRGLAEKLR
jgi:geranylgeranyl pyrophosphate synthase